MNYSATKKALEGIKTGTDNLDISLSSHRDAILGTASRTLTDLYNYLAREDTLAAIKKALASVGTDKILTTPDNPPNLDISLSTRASESTLAALKNALSSVGTDKFLTTPDNPPNLDISLSTHLGGLKPLRTSPTQDLSATSIAASGSTNIDKGNLDGYSAIVASVKPTYDASATAGVRVRWLYSPDGTNYDTADGAENEGNYQDLTFTAGATIQETVLIPILAPYVRIQIVNLDTGYAVSVDAWSWLMR